MIVEPYTPKNFGKDIYKITPLQYPMFLSVIFGLKPSYDDWISSELLDEYNIMCKAYGLVVERDIIFKPLNEDKENIVGGKNITTTFAQGAKLNDNKGNGRIHVFVSKSRETAVQAKKFGWYSVVANGRVTNKPFIDHLRFGKFLGFPGCCINFFMRYNNWIFYSHPYETFKNTPIKAGKRTGSYYCNNFLMDNIYSYIHHIPCSYGCEKTIKLANSVEEKIMDVEPGFVKKASEILKKPILVFGERNFIIFDGELDESVIKYRDSQYFKNPARLEENVDFFDTIESGNEIVMENGKIKILKNGSELRTTEKKQEWFMIGFE